MACTTILIGKDASYDGSTLISRNDDSQSGQYTEKKFVSISPDQQPKTYTSVISHCTVELPDDPMRYVCVPNAVEGEGIWAACGVNEENIAVSATETITTNTRVLGADPLVENGIGEEDIVVLTVPYIHSAREGVLRLGALLEQYGTYETNAIAFQDVNEIWWLETIGGHHWMARRVPDNAYVVMPNQLGLDTFDFEDAFDEQKNYLCSKDLKEFISSHHLDLTLHGKFNPREAFGSHDDADHVYNTPRAWYILRYLNPHTYKWDGPDADYTPESDDLPWSLVPEHKVTIEDIKYLQSSHYQGTPYDPYSELGNDPRRGAYRPIGVNRTSFVHIVQIRPYIAEEYRAIYWLGYGCNVFNAVIPLYTNVKTTPAYIANTTGTVTTDNFYWNNRLIGALCDPHYPKTINSIEHYQEAVHSQGHALIEKFDSKLETTDNAVSLCEEANEAVCEMAKKETSKTLGEVLYTASNLMKNSYARSDH